MRDDVLLLGVDGGGTQCRARLADLGRRVLGEGTAGPANIRLGLEESFKAVHEAARQCFHQAGLTYPHRRTIACLALAGASEPLELSSAMFYPHSFYRAVFTTDARAACVGAHAGQDGGVIIVGTGSIGWAIIGGEEHRVGGWGFPVSDEGSGAWLGCEAVRRVLWARDGLIRWTGLLQTLFERFGADPHAIVRWMSTAHPRDFGSFAAVVADYASQNDPVGCTLMRLAAHHIDAIAFRLANLGVKRLSLMGGLSESLEPFLADKTLRFLVPPSGDALSGALRLAQTEADFAFCLDGSR